ncbi:restriction endonuclease [Proteiniborus sp. MB09-C3]|uniref:restriction endonuclease n=1 Tax=Proteiniborus sp. MB09-C3 TaxID=3050072 RepID=UPI0025565EC6|nr:restriction endonuclease [Proteiniborus sp. MB09-C3]WIV11267.1 restriction endonuclease [Proteiniborus sp. MB09-C3]
MNVDIMKNNLKKKSINIINGMRLRRYYSEKPGTGKTYMAIILDKIIFRIIVLISFIFLFYFISESLIFSAIISLQVFVLYNLIMYKINKNKLQKKIFLVNKQVVLKKTLRELLNQSPQDFLDYIVDILEKYGFDSITKVDRRDIDIVGTISDRKVGIRCLQYDNDYKVGVDIVRDFFIELRRLELTEGVIITTSSFTHEANNLLVKLRKYAQIQLVDIEGLLEIIKKADLYPSEAEIKKIILNEISDSRMHFKSYKDVVLSKGKIIKYIFLGITMIVFGRFTPYTTYYNIVAVIIFSIAIISLIVLLINLFRVDEEKQENKVL